MKNKPDSNINKYVKYSSIGIQMIVVIFAGVYLGSFLDNKFPNKHSLFSVICILLAVCCAILFAIKDFVFKKKD